MVRPRRLELPRVLPHSDLNAARLPIPPRPHTCGSGGLAKSCGFVKGKMRGLLDFCLACAHICRMKTYPPHTKQPEWRSNTRLVPYPHALSDMEMRVADIIDGRAGELVWVLQHPPLYTAGTSAKPDDLIDPDRFPVFKAGRGGQYTYHGPGQLVVYFMLDLRKRGKDVRAFVANLEQLIIDTLMDFGVQAGRRAGRIGVWVELDDKTEAKIAAIGVRIKRWVSFHGISINVNPDLGHFDGIVPCGIREHGVTSLAALGINVNPADVERALKSNFERVFGSV